MNTNAPPKQREEMPPGLEIVIVTRVREIVDGFKVRRALPSAKRRMVGPFIFLDQMGPEILGAGRGLDVAPHPHIGLATVTYLFMGEVLHLMSLVSPLADDLAALHQLVPLDLRRMPARLNGLRARLHDEELAAHARHRPYGPRDGVRQPRPIAVPHATWPGAPRREMLGEAVRLRHARRK